MKNIQYDYDWRKQAAMTATNDLDVEKAFADQASGFVENKVGDLMKSQHRIGFEIIKKNEDNTRMVGAFAFKVDDQLLFAIVFFLNGDIKGPILYRCTTKTIVPATKEWAAYLIEDLEHNEGKGRSMHLRGESVPLVQMQRMAFRPSSMNKGASAPIKGVNTDEKKVVEIPLDPDLPRFNTKVTNKDGGVYHCKVAGYEDGTIRYEVEGDAWQFLSKYDADTIKYSPESAKLGDYNLSKEAATDIYNKFLTNVPNRAEVWTDEFLDVIAKSASTAGRALQEFLKEPNYGKAAAELLIKAASDNEGYPFANMLAGLYPDPSMLFPDEYTVVEPALEKKASAGSGELVIQYALDTLEKSASVSQKYFADGFYIKDTRPAEHMSVVIDDASSELESPTEAGLYSLLTTSGDFEDNVFVSVLDTSRNWSGARQKHSVTEYIIVKDGYINVVKNIIGIKKFEGANTKPPKSDPLGTDHAFLVYKKDTRQVTSILCVKSLSKVDGITHIEGSLRNLNTTLEGADTNYCSIWLDSTDKFIYNPEVERTNMEKGVFGKDAIFIKLNNAESKSRDYAPGSTSFSKNVIRLAFGLKNIASSASANDWIFKTFNTSKIKIDTGVKSASYCFSKEDERPITLNRCQALVKLARDWEVPAEKAYELLDQVAESGTTSFYLCPTEKVASRLRLLEHPQFDDDFDGEFGTPLRHDREYHLAVGGEQRHETPSSIGDMMNPTTTTGLPNLTVATTAPEDLRALADTYKLPHVFEHGVIGTLASTFNAQALVDKYIPKLEDGVDALGRIKFLLHWCPNDFEKAYGSDDMLNLESEIDSNFEAQGALLLKLLKKADKTKKSVDTNSYKM